MGSTKIDAPAAPAPLPSPAEQAAQINQAKLQYDPQQAKLAYQIATDPATGIKPFTQYQENVRQEVFPQEQAVRGQLAQNIYQNLASPTGITSDQQAAIDARRQLAQNELVKSLRNRANLGGNLYGGNAIEDEGRQVAQLQNQFAEEDITRQERAKLNAIQGAIPFLQLLFPDVNLSAPQFQSAVQSPDTLASSLISQRGQDMNYNTAQQNASAQALASNNALYGALFQGLGTAAGGFLGGPAGAAAGGQAGRAIMG